MAETATYRVYICKDHATGQQYLLQVATAVEHNGGLERAAFVLKELKQASDLIEAEHAKSDPKHLLNYDRLFPEVVAGFTSDEQGKRRVNILSLKDIDTVTKMVPLSNLIARDHRRVNLESGAWIMGRLLKLLSFAHSQGVAVRMLQGNNVLIEPKNHFVVVFDWSSAYTYQEDVPSENRKDDIAGAAKAVFAAIGGNPDTLDFPYDLDDRRYIELLQRFARRREGNAEEAHRSFYELLDELFGRGYRPFKTLPL